MALMVCLPLSIDYVMTKHEREILKERESKYNNQYSGSRSSGEESLRFLLIFLAHIQRILTLLTELADF